MANGETQPRMGSIRVPASGGWPLVAAFGFSLMFAGLLTHWMVSALGILCLTVGLVGWFREVLPSECTIELGVEPTPAGIAPSDRAVRHLQVGEQGHRGRFPLERHPYSAGVIGGLVGGVAMALLAVIYGLIAQRSVWYPVNLLAASASAGISQMDDGQLRVFHLTGFILALLIHGCGSALVGLLYGIALPMFPRHPMVLGGILAPIFWTGVLHSSLGIINPALQLRIHWGWFMAAQFAYGLVAGRVVARREKIATLQHVPFAIRAGIEAPMDDRAPAEKDKPRT